MEFQRNYIKKFYIIMPKSSNSQYIYKKFNSILGFDNGLFFK